MLRTGVRDRARAGNQVRSHSPQNRDLLPKPHREKIKEDPKEKENKKKGGQILERKKRKPFDSII